MGTRYTKLVRDKIPEYLDSKNIPYEKRIAEGDEYRSLLIQKLREETEEFFQAESVEELADVMEVVRALRHLPEFEEAKTIQRQKREERGGFNDGIVVTGGYQ